MRVHSASAGSLHSARWLFLGPGGACSVKCISFAAWCSVFCYWWRGRGMFVYGYAWMGVEPRTGNEEFELRAAFKVVC